MLRTIDLRGQRLSRGELLRLVPRASLEMSAAADLVRPLVDAVRERGDTALREQAREFDHVENHSLRVPPARILESLETCPADVRTGLQELIARLRLASAAQIPDQRETHISGGAVVLQRWEPVSRVGLYAPGGKAAYPSSVIMNAVAAQTAGVHSLALASPAQPDNEGLPHEAVLWASALVGLDEVYAIGGAGAIAAFATAFRSSASKPSI